MRRLAIVSALQLLLRECVAGLPRVLVASNLVSPVAIPLLQQLRLLEEGRKLSPIGVAMTEKHRKTLSKQLGEEYNELVLNPVVCFDSLSGSALLKDVKIVVVCFERSAEGMFSRFSEDTSEKLVTFIEKAVASGVPSFFLLAPEGIESDSETQLSKIQKIVQTGGASVSSIVPVYAGNRNSNER